MKKLQSKEQHEAFYADLNELLRKHAGCLSAIEMLAVASNIVGRLIALQNQRSTTPEMAMQIVAKNIETGNMEVVAALNDPKGSA